jgi:hypothetical protein
MKALYRPFGLLASVMGALLAGAMFKLAWKKVAHEDQPPKAKERDYTWKQVLPAAALEGAIFGFVKAATDRGGLRSFEKLTGVWAGD